MKNKVYFLFLLIIVFGVVNPCFSKCIKPDTDSLSQSQRDSIARYYPLNIGNEWYYLVSSSSLYGGTTTGISKYEILGKETINNKSYFKRVRTYGYYEIKYIYFDSTNLKVYVYSNGEDKLIVDLNLPVAGTFNDSINHSWQYVGPFLYQIFNSQIAANKYFDGLNEFYYIYGFGYAYDLRINYPTSNFTRLVGAKINGIVYGDTSCIIPVDIKPDIEVPANYQLSQNYPNPFNPNTNINFYLPKQSKVSLIVYNSLGELKKTLVVAELQQGNHSFDFDATGLPSGIYFAKLTTNEYSKTIKMVYNK